MEGQASAEQEKKKENKKKRKRREASGLWVLPPWLPMKAKAKKTALLTWSSNELAFVLIGEMGVFGVRDLKPVAGKSKDHMGSWLSMLYEYTLGCKLVDKVFKILGSHIFGRSLGWLILFILWNLPEESREGTLTWREMTKFELESDWYLWMLIFLELTFEISL
jgi:hypothetical protein